MWSSEDHLPQMLKSKTTSSDEVIIVSAGNPYITNQRKHTDECLNDSLLCHDMLQIGVDNNDKAFLIHAALLQDRCPELFNLWNKTKPDVYRCEDTEMAVLHKVMQWMYNGFYDEHHDAKDAETEADDHNAINEGVFLHAGIYIFGHIYLIDELKEIASLKFRDSLVELKKADSAIAVQQTVSVVYKLFSQLHETDSLLNELVKIMLKGSSDEPEW